MFPDFALDERTGTDQLLVEGVRQRRRVWKDRRCRRSLHSKVGQLILENNSDYKRGYFLNCFNQQLYSKYILKSFASICLMSIYSTPSG